MPQFGLITQFAPSKFQIVLAHIVVKSKPAEFSIRGEPCSWEPLSRWYG